MKKQEKIFYVDVPPEDMCAAMRDPIHIERNEKGRDAIEVEIKDIEKTDNKHVYEIHTVTYARTIKGLDKSKTEKNMNLISWDLKKMSGVWKVTTEHGPKVNVTGGYDVATKGRGSQVTMRVNIDIKIPIVGKIVEKFLEKAFVKEWPNYISNTEQYARTLLSTKD